MDNHFPDLRNKKSFDPEIIDDFDSLSVDGRSYLQEAIAYRNEFVRYFILKSKNYDHQDKNGQTALQYLISRSMYDFALELLERGTSINIIDKYGNDPLWTAVLNPKPSIEIIKRIVDLGGDPKRQNLAGRSALDIARTKNNDLMLKIFGDL